VFRGARLDEINGWVKRKTEGMIEKLLDRLDPDFAAVLLNAIYFKAPWAVPFSKQSTMEATFNLSRARQVQVPTMRRLGRHALVSRQIYRAVRLPYAIGSLGMVVVLPDELEGLADVSKRLDERELTEMLAVLRAAPSQMVDLGLPRFKTEFKADLKGAFQQQGMSLAFSRDQADFSGMTGQPVAKGRLAIGQITHAAVIDVQEDGTEAAAATAVVMVPMSAPPRREVAFLVDRPFLFYLVDDLSGAILFQGRIIDPR
jgi:serpin B